jgi:hypothetical protein
MTEAPCIVVDHGDAGVGVSVFNSPVAPYFDLPSGNHYVVVA